MRAFLMTMLIVLGSCWSVLADEPVRLLDNMEHPTAYIRWTGHSIPFAGEVTLDTTDYKQGSGCLCIDVELLAIGPGRVSWPVWDRYSDPAQNDWTGYGTLRYWVKVVSGDPSVQSRVRISVFR